MIDPAILLDSCANQCYEAIVSLAQNAVIAYRHIAGAQPSMTMGEFQWPRPAASVATSF